jgi:hypothetical protein
MSHTPSGLIAIRRDRFRPGQLLTPSGRRPIHEANHILRSELRSQAHPMLGQSKVKQILVEVVEHRRQHQGLDPGGRRPVVQGSTAPRLRQDRDRARWLKTALALPETGWPRDDWRTAQPSSEGAVASCAAKAWSRWKRGSPRHPRDRAAEHRRDREPSWRRWRRHRPTCAFGSARSRRKPARSWCDGASAEGAVPAIAVPAKGKAFPHRQVLHWNRPAVGGQAITTKNRSLWPTQTLSRLRMTNASTQWAPW